MPVTQTMTVDPNTGAGILTRAHAPVSLKLYADARLWLNMGWCDYWCPQLYWAVNSEKQSYPKLLAWWAGENAAKRHLWVGNYTSRVMTEGAKGWPASEVVEQIKVTREQGAGGNVHFSMKSLLRNAGGVADELAKVYVEPALVPASPWLGAAKPGKPRAEWAAEKSIAVRVAAGASSTISKGRCGVSSPRWPGRSGPRPR